MADPSPPLRLYLLGPPEVRVGDTPVTFPTRKALALLTYLVVEPGGHPRDHLSALLWPEASPVRSLASLRNTLGRLQSALRQASGQKQPPFLSISRAALALNPDAPVELDLQRIDRAYTQARSDRSSRARPLVSASRSVLQAAAASHRGDFLAGFSLGSAPDYDDWVGTQREIWRRRLGLILDRQSEIQFAAGDFAATAETAALWIILDPLNELAYRRKMRAYFAAGERGQALETYATCRALLAQELHAEPDPQTEALAVRIRIRSTPGPFELGLAPQDAPVACLEALFAGRETELRTLTERFDQALSGQPQVAVVQGEAGIGKTRLATEFLRWAGVQGALVLPGVAFETGSHMPFHPLVAALRVWLRHEPEPRQLVGQVGLAPLSELLPELDEQDAGLRSPAIETGGQGQTQLFEAFVQLTLVLARRSPLVLFIDDLQWADNATLDLLQYAIRRWREVGAQVLLLLSLRSDSVPFAGQPEASLAHAWLARLERESQLGHVHLATLSQHATIQMVLSVLTPAVADFAQWLFADTRGHPFYLLETLKDLLERGVLRPRRRADGRWGFELDSDHELGKAVQVPSTVGAVVRSRLNRLSPNAFALLAAGAVLEQGLTFEPMRIIAGVSADAALAALDELLSSRLLVEVASSAGRGAYDFPNGMIRDVVYTDAGDARRRLFHRRALDILAETHDPAAVLAHHARVAGQAETAFFHSLAAGREALRLSAPSEALIHFEAAHQLAREAALAGAAFGSHLRDLYQQLGQAYEQGGQTLHAAAIFGELRSLAGEQGETT